MQFIQTSATIVSSPLLCLLRRTSSIGGPNISSALPAPCASPNQPPPPGVSVRKTHNLGNTTCVCPVTTLYTANLNLNLNACALDAATALPATAAACKREASICCR